MAEEVERLAEVNIARGLGLGLLELGLVLLGLGLT